MNNYLKHIASQYNTSSMRYCSDSTILDKLEQGYFSKYISHEIINNDYGHMIIYRDDRIPKVVFFGFYELRNPTLNNYQAMEKIIISKAIDGEIILGPYNLSLWNTYRFASRSPNISLMAEYTTNPVYHQYMIGSTYFNTYESYLTGYRSAQHIPHKPVILTQGYTISLTQLNQSSLEIIFNISQQTFIKAPLISSHEWKCFGGQYLQYTDSTLVHFIYYNEVPVGMCLSLHQGNVAIIKTIAIIPQHQSQGLGSQLLQHIYNHYLQLGVNDFYYLYMREGDDALGKFTHEHASIHNTYHTFSYKSGTILS